MGFCGTKVAAPAPRDVAGEYRDTLLTQMQAHRGIGPFADVGALPDLEAEARPGYVALDLQTLEQTMGGVDGQRGLLDQYEHDIYPTLNRIEARGKQDRAEADQAVLDQYGASTTDAIRRSSGNDQLMRLLRERAESDLEAGGRLNPGEEREYQQAARSAQAARGFGYGNNDAFMEAMNTGMAAERRKREREGFAQSVAQQLQLTGGDPMMALLGRPSQTLGMGQNFGAQGYGVSQNLGTQLFNPESAYAADAYRSNQQSQLAADTATGANRANVMGGLFSGLGSLAGGLLGGR